MKNLLTILVLVLMAYIGVWIYHNQTDSVLTQNAANVLQIEVGKPVAGAGVILTASSSSLRPVGHASSTVNLTTLDASFLLLVNSQIKPGVVLPVRGSIELYDVTNPRVPILTRSQTIQAVTEAGLKVIEVNKPRTLQFTASFPFPKKAGVYRAAFKKMVSANGALDINWVTAPFSFGTTTATTTVKTVTLNLTNASSTITTTKMNNRDTAVVSNIKMYITPVGGEISAVNGLTADIAIKNVATGAIIDTKTVNGLPVEPGLNIIPEGARRSIEFVAVFNASSSIPRGTTNIKAVVTKITYKPLNTGVIQTITTGLSPKFDSYGYTSFSW